MPTQRWVTVDQGNTALSVVVWELGAEGGPVHVRSHAVHAGLDELPAVGTEGEVQGVASSSVRGPARGELHAELTARFGARAVAAGATECGLELDLETPETTGADRLFAARAARELCAAESCVVVDAGTAMTVDLVVGRTFRGGAIAPGAGTLAGSLAQRGAQLFEITPRPGVSALGRSSRAALEAGVVVGLRGAARALVAGLVAEAPAGAVELVVAGGDRGLLLAPTSFAAELAVAGRELSPARCVPLLVHLGLLCASVPGLVLEAGAFVERAEGAV